MASTFTSPLITTGTPINGASSRPPPGSVNFRRPLRVSAGYNTSTAERSTTSQIGQHRIAANSLYEVLGIPVGATCQEIKGAYRKLARVLHPDVARGSESNNEENKGYEFMKVHEAYSTLCDPEKRADYDRIYFSQCHCHCEQQVKPMSFGFGMRTRTWETDQCW